MSGRPAAFLDRDGTIMRDASYVSDASDIELLPGAAEAIKRLNARAIPVIVVTNQSGIARGLVAPREYELVRERLSVLLSAHGAHIDATYMCPHLPDITGRCECRKPGTALYTRAIADHGLDPTRSLFTGDRLRDVRPAQTLGGIGILVVTESTPAADLEQAAAEHVVRATSLSDAVDKFLSLLPASDHP